MHRQRQRGSSNRSYGITSGRALQPRRGESQAGIWYHFGPNYDKPRVGSGETTPQPNFGANRIADLEKQMWALVNQDRMDPGASAEIGGWAQPLRWNERPAAVARTHSRAMLEQGFFGHVDADGETLSARISEAGIPPLGGGENIAIYTTVPGTEGAFMNEPRFRRNHLANISNPNYTEVGIGIVQGPDGSLCITQDFVAIPPERHPKLHSWAAIGEVEARSRNSP